MARPGWSAKALLQPLWKQYPGGRDALASAVGTTGASLSSRNSGRLTLGRDLGQRLAAELSRELGREVSLLELGAPEAEADDRGETLYQRLGSLADDLAEAVQKQARMGREIGQLRGRIRRLEAHTWPDEASSTGRSSR